MKTELQVYKQTLKIITNVIDDIKYERSARVYTLDEDEMGRILFCRDFAEKVLNDWMSECNH